MIGFGIGWLMGLSVSPVVSIVISSVTGSAAAVIAALSGLKRHEGWTVNPWPMALLLLGLLLGSAAGLRVRNENLLGQNVRAEIERWQAAGLTMKDSEVAQRLFDINYPAAGSAVQGSPGQAAAAPGRTDSVLFSVDASECETWLTYEGEDLARQLEGATDERLRPLAQIEDRAALKQIVEVLCAGHS